MTERDVSGHSKTNVAARVSSAALPLLALSWLVACATTAPGASDAHLAQARSRAAQGGAIFDRACQSCHGPRGEGLAGAPPILGATALPRYPRDQAGVQLYQDPQQLQRQAQLRLPGAPSRIELVTARDVYDYLKVHMSTLRKPASVGELTEEELWSVVSFLLIARGSDVPAPGVSPANAASVLIAAP
jgi:cytochrome c5